MKICFLLHEGSMFSGGQGVYLSNLTRELAALGHEVHVIGGPPYPDLAAGVRLHKVQSYNFHRLLATGRRFFYGRPPLDVFHPLNLGELVTTRLGMYSVMGAFSIRAYQRLRELLARGQRFDVVHDNQVLGYGTLLIRALGVPVVATVHHPLTVDRENRVREARSASEQVRAVLFYPFFMQRFVVRRVDRVVAVSPSAARSVARAFDLDEAEIAIVRNGVDTDTFRPLADVEREQDRILFVGDPEDRNKGFRYLLLALARLAPSTAFRLVVVQRSWSNEAPREAAELGLGGRVTFIDSLSTDELAREYNRAQLLVSPSLYEGFGLPAAEAAACGTPVVATRAGALPEIVQDGETGLLVPTGNADALAQAIATLLGDSRRCASMGEAGARRVRERFSWRRAAAETAELYEQVAGSRVVAAPVLELVR
ncbi:MAG: glycosyltransferase family 4 protein [Dehalococcoidia bacterium]